MENKLRLFEFKGSEITFKLDNGDIMVNLTEMAKPFSKETYDFIRLDQTQEFIRVLTLRLKPGNPGLVTKRGGLHPGTWAHQKIALKFAAWLSPEFELWVYDRIEELLTTGNVSFTYPKTYKDALKELISQIELTEQAELKISIQNNIIHEQKPKVRFADSVAASTSTILVADLAKILKQNGINIGEKRLYRLLREDEFLGSRGSHYNRPTQKSMDLGLFETLERTITKPTGDVMIRKTTKVTGRGQLYFIDLYMNKLPIGLPKSKTPIKRKTKIKPQSKDLSLF